MSLYRSIPAALILLAGAALPAQDAGRTISIVASKFAFAPAEVRLKKGETVVLALTSQDTTHGLKSDDLDFNTKIKAGEVTKVTLTPQKTGSFTAKCSSFCGSGHSDMKMTFIVE